MNLNGINIAVLGLGVSGTSTVKALLKLKAKPILFNDGKVESWLPEEFKTLPAFDSLDNDSRAKNFDLLIKSPGVPNDHPMVIKSLEASISIITEIELAYAFANAPIIALTGTNGKTTTTMMIDQLLKYEGVNVFTGGNIGLPFCEIILDDKKFDVYNLELSSFQIEYLNKFKANHCAILNISMSHQERYSNFQDYESAKLNIYNNLDDNCFSIAPKDKVYSRNGKCLDFSNEDIQIFCKEFDFTSFKLKGDFHLANIYVASKLVESFLGRKPQTQKLIDEFQGAPFRLQYVGKFNDLDLYNDSKSTNWQATISALKQFTSPPYLILGGQQRDQSTIAQEIVNFILKNTKQVFLIGDAQETLSTHLGAHAISLDSLESVKKFVIDNKLKGELLFSPAFPSFDQFENYLKRGERFNDLFN